MHNYHRALTITALLSCAACSDAAPRGIDAAGNIDATSSTADAAPNSDGTAAVDANTSDSGTSDSGGTDGSSADAGAPTQLVPPGEINGELADGDQLQGAYTLTGAVTVRGNATVHILPGTTLTSPSFGLVVKGVLNVKGSKDAPVVVTGPSTGKAWAGIVVSGTMTATWLEVSQAVINVQSQAGATLTLDHCHMHHAEQYNLLSRGASTLTRMLIEQPRKGANATFNLGIKGGEVVLMDSVLRETPNECVLSEDNATLTAHYNQFDTGHCGVHFNTTKSAELLNNQFKGNLYGLMIFGVGQAEIHGNNFTASSTLEILANNAQKTSVDATGNYWGDKKKFALAGAKIDTGGALSAPATDVGPRPE